MRRLLHAFLEPIPVRVASPAGSRSAGGGRTDSAPLPAIGPFFGGRGIEECSTEAGMRAIPWATLQHAAGAADDVPTALASLRSEDDDERDFAVSWLIETVFEDAEGDVCLHSATLPTAEAILRFIGEEPSSPAIEETQAELADLAGELYGRLRTAGLDGGLLALFAPFAGS